MIIIAQKHEKLYHFHELTQKAGVHRLKCTPAEILSLPTVTVFLFCSRRIFVFSDLNFESLKAEVVGDAVKH